MLLGRGLVIMKLKSSLALLVVFTLLMTSIVCSADVSVNTTTTYTADGFSVTTTATGLENDSMVAYAIYGPGSFSNGSITNGTDSSITVGTDGTTNIKYIDQQTVANGSVTFTTAANSSALANFAGAKIKLGSSDDANQAVLAATAPIIDQNTATYTLAVSEWDDNLGYVKVEVMGGDNVAYTVNLTKTNTSVNVLVGAGVKFTFYPKMGYKLDGSYKLDDADLGITESNKTATVTPETTKGGNAALALGTCVKVATDNQWVSVDAATRTNTGILVLMNNATDAIVGVNITVKDESGNEVATVKGLDAVGGIDGALKALTGYCGVLLINADLMDSTYTYDVTPYYLGSDGEQRTFGTPVVGEDGVKIYNYGN